MGLIQPTTSPFISWIHHKLPKYRNIWVEYKPLRWWCYSVRALRFFLDNSVLSLAPWSLWPLSQVGPLLIGQTCCCTVQSIVIIWANPPGWMGFLFGVGRDVLAVFGERQSAFRGYSVTFTHFETAFQCLTFMRWKNEPSGALFFFSDLTQTPPHPRPHSETLFTSSQYISDKEDWMLSYQSQI